MSGDTVVAFPLLATRSNGRLQRSTFLRQLDSPSHVGDRMLSLKLRGGEG